jgi:hypothetical protein
MAADGFGEGSRQDTARYVAGARPAVAAPRTSGRGVASWPPGKRHSDAGVFQYGNYVDWTAITAIGTILAGLALPLAFLQLDAQHVNGPDAVQQTSTATLLSSTDLM